MRILVIIVASILTCGCVSLGDLLGARDPLFTLSPYPEDSGCSRSECRRLDSIEEKGYELARSGKLTWVRFVDAFYIERNKLFPNAEEDNESREYRAYQRFLAEQMDMKKITESQWVYLLERKRGELSARSQVLESSKPRMQNCVTERVGLPPFESYQTRCR